MFRWIGRAVALIAIVILAVVNVRVAAANWDDGPAAHPWEAYHWDKSRLEIQLSGSHQNQAVRAANVWNGRTDLTLPSNRNHTDISVWGAYYGDTGWAGLATVEGRGWDWHCWTTCRLTHVHARYNRYYRSSNSWYAQKVFCHELGHAFGFTHNSSGGCMISGYWPRLSNEPSSHDVRDTNSQY